MANKEEIRQQEDKKNNSENETINEEKNEIDNDVEYEENFCQNVNKEDEQIEELNNRLLRLQADFLNYKNRVEKEKKNIYSYATEDIINQLLPVLDNFERALSNIDNDNNYYEGIKMIYDQMIDVLNKNGLKEIECDKKPFDPNFHHAVFMEESKEKEEGIILEVLQKGYMLNDKVIRPSMVKVAK